LLLIVGFTISSLPSWSAHKMFGGGFTTVMRSESFSVEAFFGAATTFPSEQ
jgi:hypothetical protein